MRKFDIDGGEDPSEDPDDVDANNSPVHRKKRGLKILSVKVRELVERKGVTTYKDVANELIDELKEGKRNNSDGLFDLIDCIDDNNDEDMSLDESPDKRVTASGSKKDSGDG